jgi:mono/diheme cytochrome c family protein
MRSKTLTLGVGLAAALVVPAGALATQQLPVAGASGVERWALGAIQLAPEAGRGARGSNPKAQGPRLKALPAPGLTPKAQAGSLSPAAVDFFEREIRPVLAENCYSCHGPKASQSGLRLDSRAAVLKGGVRGSALSAGAPEKSWLLRSVRHQGLQMPPGRKLADKHVEALAKWVAMGTPWPATTVQAAGPQSWDEVVRTRKDWWSLKPVREVAPPAVKDRAWSAQPVDRFVLAALEAKGLRPAPEADARTLCRRLYLVLTGLPPTADEVEAFVRECEADRVQGSGFRVQAPNRPTPLSPLPKGKGLGERSVPVSEKAYERLVDRLLASPGFGEAWARHWMDLVRYGETHGYEWNYEVADAWRYRDYLIRAFNRDVPYDQMIREHLAGDLLPQPRRNPEDGSNESAIGTAFYRFGENGHDVFKEIGLDVLDNQIDTLSKAFQATTVSCARCHDHKLDAVSTKDYYRLLGVLASSQQVAHTIDGESANARQKQQLRELKGLLRAELAATWSREAQEVGRYLRAAQAARDKKPDAASLAAGLDPARLQAWVTALEKKGSGLEDPLQPWSAAASAADVAAVWTQLAAQYEQESHTRAESNRKSFLPFGDFRNGKPDGWRIDGLGLRDGPCRSGDFVVADEGDGAIATILPAGYYTHSLSQRLNGSIQSPFLPTDRGYVSLRVMGGKSGVLREIPDHRQLTDTGKQLKPDPYGWVTLPRSKRDEWVYLELITKFHNPRFTDDTKDPRSFFGISEAVLHDGAQPPKDELSSVRRLFTGAGATSLEEVGARYAETMRQATTAWADGKATDDDAKWLNWLVSKGLLSNSVKQSSRLAQLVEQYRSVEKTVAPARIVAGVADQEDGFDVPIYRRGDYRSPGEVVHRGYLALFAPEESASPRRGSGRSELAEMIADPKNPLTGRVLVNRVWGYLFGTGIVRTPDDFGHMGEAPSHPLLLDWLASTFVRTSTSQREGMGVWGYGGMGPSPKGGPDSPKVVAANSSSPLGTEQPSRGRTHTPTLPHSHTSPNEGLATDGCNWSVKKLIRMLVMSRTFRQSSQGRPAPDPRSAAGNPQLQDPENRLLHQYPARRLEAEAVRDSILAVSGRLDRTLYGPSIQPYRLEPEPERRLFPGPLDGNGRRSVYIKVTLMQGSKFLEVFNFPDPKMAQGRRDVTNVPAQALTLMNDPFVIGQAEFWAERLVAAPDGSVAARIDRMFRTALGRPPLPAEQQRFELMVRDLASLLGVAEGDVLKSKPVWKDVAHTIFNFKEFIYVR